jgi:hypothetical protein
VRGCRPSPRSARSSASGGARFDRKTPGGGYLTPPKLCLLPRPAARFPPGARPPAFIAARSGVALCGKQACRSHRQRTVAPDERHPAHATGPPLAHVAHCDRAYCQRAVGTRAMRQLNAILNARRALAHGRAVL